MERFKELKNAIKAVRSNKMKEEKARRELEQKLEDQKLRASHKLKFKELARQKKR